LKRYRSRAQRGQASASSEISDTQYGQRMRAGLLTFTVSLNSAVPRRPSLSRTVTRIGCSPAGAAAEATSMPVGLMPALMRSVRSMPLPFEQLHFHAGGIDLGIAARLESDLEREGAGDALGRGELHARARA
jgi:hypothetical protein